MTEETEAILATLAGALVGTVLAVTIAYLVTRRSAKTST